MNINHANIDRFLTWARGRLQVNDQLSDEIRAGMLDAHNLANHAKDIADPTELPSSLAVLRNMLAENDTETGCPQSSPAWAEAAASVARLTGDTSPPTTTPVEALRTLLRATAAFVSGESGASDSLTLAMFQAERVLGGAV
jgi:hypothetical protein